MKKDIEIEYLFIVILIILGIYYIYLASITPMLGEDEDVYFSLAKDFSNSVYAPYDFLGNPKSLPNFMPLFFSFSFLIFGASLSVAKGAVAFFALLTLLMVYITGRKLNIYFGFFSALILLSIIGFSNSSMLAYVEVPIAFFSIFFVYLLLNLDVKSNSFIFKSFVIGSILGISYHTKFSGLILLFVLFLYCSFSFLFKRNKEYIKLFLISLCGFLLVVSPFIIRNLIIYKYPFFEGLNYLFKGHEPAGPLMNIKWVIEAAKLISPATISLNMFIETFGLIGLFFGIFGISWLLSNFNSNLIETKFLILLILPAIVFLIIFYLFYLTGYITVDPRYFSIIFPQFSLLGGFFLWKFKEKNKYFLIILIPIIFFAIYSGVTVAQATSVSQRYSNEYVEALKWLKTNAPKNSLIFTAYGGSVDYFAERRSIWTINEFPDVMHSGNGTYIYDTLKKYNITHILIWRGIVAQDYMVPQSNLMGAFTYNFVNVASNDNKDFETAFQNQDNIIFKLK